MDKRKKNFGRQKNSRLNLLRDGTFCLKTLEAKKMQQKAFTCSKFCYFFWENQVLGLNIANKTLK